MFLDGVLQRDKDEFARVCNRLLSNCFICKNNEATRKDYYFVTKYRKEFQEYLSVLGYRLEINEEYGVIQVTNPMNYNRYNMKLMESIIILILRILYDAVLVNSSRPLSCKQLSTKGFCSHLRSKCWKASGHPPAADGNT